MMIKIDSEYKYLLIKNYYLLKSYDKKASEIFGEFVSKNFNKEQ